MRHPIDRRSFLASLPVVAAVPRLMARSGRRRLSALGLNHVVLGVSDPQRSVEFYQGLLGMPIQARQGSSFVLRIGDGPQFMAIQPAGAEAPGITRMGIAVGDFDVERIIESLSEFGIRSAGAVTPPDKSMRVWTATRGPDAGGASGGTTELYLGDPHGIVIQIVGRDHCGGGGPLGSSCGAAEPAPGPGLIPVLDLNHFTSNVSDPDRANQFYQEIFGIGIQVYQAAAAAIDIDAGGPQFLMFTGGGANTPAGAPPRGTINHVCLTVEGYETDALLSTLADYGIRPRAEGEGANVPLTSFVSMRMPNRGGAPGGTPELYFTDPDGLRIQLQDTTYCGGGGVLGSVC